MTVSFKHTICAGLVSIGFAIATPNSAQSQETKTFELSPLLETQSLEDMAVGRVDAAVTIIEYASMTCPHCADFHKDIYPTIKKNYIDTGKVRMIFREFPLDQLSAAASMLARCVDRSRYFPFISVLFTQQSEWVVQNPIDPLRKLAKQAGLNNEAFDKCLSNQELLDGIVWIKDRGQNEFDVTGTPSFFVNGEFVSAQSSRDFDDFAKIIDKHLGE
jgi:protein-disulfide isomerase